MRTTGWTMRSLALLLERGGVRRLGMPALVIAVAMLVAAVLLLGVNVSALRGSFEWVQKSDDILLEISEVENAVIGHELTVRGYALSNDPVFLRYEDSERGHIARAMHRLAALASGDPQQTRLESDLQRSIARHTAVFSQLTALGPGHAADVARAIRDPAKRSVMAAARDGIEAFRTAELAILAQRQARAARQASRTYGLAVGIVMAAFLLGGLGVFVSQFGRGAAAVAGDGNGHAGESVPADRKSAAHIALR